MSEDIIPVEKHPLEPFLPKNARVLMLGSFPPSKKRWSMNFYYPNRQNDMWRIFGVVFFNDKNYFFNVEKNSFVRDKIIEFLNGKGIALYDTACAIRRTKNTASDKDLEIVERTDIKALLDKIPFCHTLVTTGQKATDELMSQFDVAEPKVGGYSDFEIGERNMRLYRMPSSSRAYPLKMEKKALFYKEMFDKELCRV